MSNENKQRFFPGENQRSDLGYDDPFETPTPPEVMTPVRKGRLVTRGWHRDNEEPPVERHVWLSPEDQKRQSEANARGASMARAALLAPPEKPDEIVSPVDAARTMTTLNGAALVREALSAARARGVNSGRVSQEVASVVVSDLREEQ